MIWPVNFWTDNFLCQECFRSKRQPSYWRCLTIPPHIIFLYCDGYSCVDGRWCRLYLNELRTDKGDCNRQLQCFIQSFVLNDSGNLPHKISKITSLKPEHAKKNIYIYIYIYSSFVDASTVRLNRLNQRNGSDFSLKISRISLDRPTAVWSMIYCSFCRLLIRGE